MTFDQIFVLVVFAYAAVYSLLMGASRLKIREERDQEKTKYEYEVLRYKLYHPQK